MALIYCPTLEPDTPPWVAAVCVAAGHRAEQCVCKCLAHVCFTCIAHQFTYIEKNEGLSMKGCRLLSAADPGLEGLQRRPGGRVGGWCRLVSLADAM